MERVLIIGTGESAKQVALWINEKFDSEYSLVGFADTDQERLGQALVSGARIQTDYDALPEFAAGPPLALPVNQ